MIGEGRVVGLDLGSRRIGVAVTDTRQTIATAVATLPRKASSNEDRQQVARIVAEYDAVGIVLGLPLSMSGAEGQAASAARREAADMSKTLGIDVELVDERLTTVAAVDALRASGRDARQQRSVVDQSAAVLMLQTWVDRRRTGQGLE